MEKKVECEIVQDLLLGYVDNTLNEKSKKLVEKHLIECEGCKKRLAEMENDIKENEFNEQKQIDYLKKIRRKNKIKSIIFAIVIILIICVIIYLNKFIMINNIVNKAKKTLETNNFYRESMEILGDNQTSVIKEYYKDGKYKQVWQIYSDEGVKTQSVQYLTENSNEVLTIYEDEKKATRQTDDFAKMLSTTNALKGNPFIQAHENIIMKLGTAFIMSIHTDRYGSNKEYYVIRNQFEKTKAWEIHVDKETGLVIQETNSGSAKEFFPGTEVVKRVRDVTQEYKYEFGIVTDEDVEVPNLSEYTIETR